MSAIDETTVVLPGPAGSMDLFLNSDEVARQFALTERNGVPVLPPGIEADYPVDMNAPLVGGLERLPPQSQAFANLGLVLVGGAALFWWLSKNR